LRITAEELSCSAYERWPVPPDFVSVFQASGGSGGTDALPIPPDLFSVFQASGGNGGTEALPVPPDLFSVFQASGGSGGGGGGTVLFGSAAMTSVYSERDRPEHDLAQERRRARVDRHIRSVSRMRIF
jgi:hypothetical protein